MPTTQLLRKNIYATILFIIQKEKDIIEKDIPSELLNEINNGIQKHYSKLSAEILNNKTLTEKNILLTNEVARLEKKLNTISEKKENKPEIIKKYVVKRIKSKKTYIYKNKEIENKNILFISGEPISPGSSHESPGTIYRCNRNAQACIDAGYNARVVSCAEVSYEDIAWADFAFLWRIQFSGHVSIILDLCARENVITIFDTDDIVFVPHYARINIIDGIRTIGTTEESTERTFCEMRRTLARCQYGSTTTLELVSEMHALHPTVHLLPNVFDHEAHRLSRMHLRLRGEPNRPPAILDIIRIGYAAGTRTHQRDFASASRAIADILKLYPNVRLVLFYQEHNKKPVLFLEEFPELSALSNQIEWREMVSLEKLPTEFARFDISIAPIEPSNVFCNAKSEIKFLEASLAGAASIVGRTGPFLRIVRENETGLFADTTQEWRDALISLIEDPQKRLRLAQNAYHDVLFPFGPLAQSQRMKQAIMSMESENGAAIAGEQFLARTLQDRPALPVIPDSDTLFYNDFYGESRVTVVITLYNYADYIIEALDSVSAQTEPTLDLIVVDDGSSDGSTELARTWMERNTARFNRLVLRRSCNNAGLGGARNIGMAAAETPYILQLDADNRLRPEACTTLLDAMAHDTAFSYPEIACFDENGPVIAQYDPDFPQPPGTPLLLSNLAYNPFSLISGNHIDAMALISKWAWAAVGGYYVSREAMGWEDFDLWCSFAERGFAGKHVPQVLADYRYHDDAMTNNSTESAAHKAKIVEFVQKRHPWIRLTAKQAKQRT